MTIQSRRYPLVLHATYYEKDLRFSEIPKLTSDLGASGLEFRRNTPEGESVESYLDALQQVREEASLSTMIPGAMGPNLMLDSASDRLREINQYIEFLEQCMHRFPLERCNLLLGPLSNPDASIPRLPSDRHGSALVDTAICQRVARDLQPLCDFAREHDLLFALETHPHYIHDTLNATLKLIDCVGSSRIGLNMDYANFLTFENTPSLKEAYRRAGKHLFLVHLKNLVVRQDFELERVGLGDGTVSIPDQLECLQDQAYCGPLVLEAPRPGYRPDYARDDFKYIQSLNK